MLTKRRILELFDVDLDAGTFTRKVSVCGSKGKAGNIAGHIHSRGYIRIAIDRKQYYAHRLIWFLAFGRWPRELDHVNGIKHDNRIANLRECTRAENNRNRGPGRNNKSTGVKNIYLMKGKYQVAFRIDKMIKYFGTYKTLAEAIKVAVEVRRRLHRGFTHP